MATAIKVIKEEVIDGVTYSYYNDGSYVTEEVNDDGVRITSVYRDGINLSNKTLYYSLDNCKYYTYYTDGKVKSLEEINGENYQYAKYDAYGRIIQKDINEVSTTYKYDIYNQVTSARTENVIEKTTLLQQYTKGNITSESFSNDGRISWGKEYKNGVITKSSEYSYYNNGSIKTLKEIKYYNQIINKSIYNYDENGNTTLLNEFYKKDKLFMQFDRRVDYIYDEKTNEYIFMYETDDYATSIKVDENGNKRYFYEDYDYSEHSHELILKNDGTFEIPGKESGKYQINSDGNILCTDKNNNKYEYDSFGVLIKKETSDGIIEYNNQLNSQKTIKGNKSSYSRINHIEYDEEEYDIIMQKLIDIHDEFPLKLNSDYETSVEIINSFEDKYSTNNLTNINTSVQNTITSINELKESINYSLLSYQTCDEHLEENTHALIESLFGESEIALANAFKHNISKYIEDADNNKILEFKSDTDFNNTFYKLIPKNSYTDEDGNIWYYNSFGNLIAVQGDNPHIVYGGETFKVGMTENGLIKVVDSKGRPLNIFGDYNIESKQYGGNQTAFEWLYGDQENLDNVLKKYFPSYTTEEKYKYFDSIVNHGCGNVAMANMIFKELEGQEDKFYDLFGFPMYNINKDNDNMIIDYNYEPVILDVFCSVNKGTYGIVNSTNNANGTSSYDFYNMYQAINENYGLFKDDFENFMDKSGILSVADYNIYSMDGELLYPNGGGHAMIAIDEIDNKHWIVSTWGEKLICELKYPRTLERN